MDADTRPVPRRRSGYRDESDGARQPWLIILLVIVLVMVISEGAALAMVWHDDAVAWGQVRDIQGRLGKADTLNRALTLQAKHPTLGMWNDCGGTCTLGPNDYRAGGVPDTFTLHISLSADSPVMVALLSLEQYATFIECPLTRRTSDTQSCLFFATGPTDPRYESIGTSIQMDFHDAEGCASYVMVIVSAFGVPTTLRPNVSVTYNPASHPTGVCAKWSR